ncbi:hypothetical protein SDC9_109718 [bioreactor metagenome]|uniref:Uncharacterized protein n=1 Tax=bioreactor metagenome TaxID=1076179 RepID=A0A645BBK9_9ZZZZ
MEQLTVVDIHKRHCKEQSNILCCQCAKGYSGDSHIEPQGKEYACQKVCYIDGNIHHHWTYGVLHPDEPAFENEERKGCRCSPDSDVKVCSGKLFGGGGCVYNQKGCLEVYYLDNPNEQSCRESCSQRLYEHPECITEIPPSVGLCCQTSCPNPQEPHVPVEEVKQHRGNSDGSDAGCIAQPSGYCHIYHSYKRYRYVCQYAGSCQLQNFPVHLYFSSSSSMLRYDWYLSGVISPFSTAFLTAQPGSWVWVQGEKRQSSSTRSISGR